MIDVIAAANSGISLLGEDRLAQEGEAAILTLSSVATGVFHPHKYKVVTEEHREKLVLSPKANRILISRSNTPDLVGAAAYVDIDYPKLFLPDLLWQLEPRNEQENSMRWLLYWLQSDIGRAAINKIASGSSTSMVKISKAAFLQIPLILPPLAEQRRSAAVFEACDREIALLEQKRQLLKQQKQGLMQQLLTGRVRVNVDEVALTPQPPLPAAGEGESGRSAAPLSPLWERGRG